MEATLGPYWGGKQGGGNTSREFPVDFALPVLDAESVEHGTAEMDVQQTIQKHLHFVFNAQQNSQNLVSVRD